MSERPMNPGSILGRAGAFWEACALHAAVKLDLFTALGDQTRSAGDVAAAIGGDPRGVETLLNAMVAMELVEKADARFRNTPLSQTYLVKGAPGYLGYIIKHNSNLVDSWSRLDEAVLKGEPVRRRISHEPTDEQRESFLLGMHNVASQLAGVWAPEIDLGGARRLLDLGGGPGTWAIHFCQANAELRATLFDLPTSRPFAEGTIAGFGLSERVEFHAGDYLSDPIPGRFDAIWVSQVLHSEGPEGCQTLLDKAAGALSPGGRLLVHEFLLDEDLAGPLRPALFALNMLVGTPAGRSYSTGQIGEMLRRAGAERVETLELRSPTGSGIVVGYWP